MVSIAQVSRVDGVPRGCAFHRARRATSARWAALGLSLRRIPPQGDFQVSREEILASGPVKTLAMQNQCAPSCRCVALCAPGEPTASPRLRPHSSKRAGAAFPGPTTHDKEP